jgi:hypothetical protein
MFKKYRAMGKSLKNYMGDLFENLTVFNYSLAYSNGVP